MTRRWPVAGVLFGVLWVFVRGAPLSPDPMLGQFLFGLVVGMPIAFVFRRLYSEGIDLRRTLRSIPYVFLYVSLFTREVVVGNIDVTYRVLAPSQPIEPEVILIPLRVRTDLGVTTIANSITITPGTITLDYDESENALYVHVIDGRDPEAIVRPIRNWEDYALTIFDEDLSPGDPAPDFAVYPPDQTHPVLQQAGGGPDTPPAEAGESDRQADDEESESDRPADGEESESDRPADGETGPESGGEADGR
ncbi:multicomponent Na+:H+ antiporter subunit E [Halomicrobium zhouii]|uniref:Multicomponent Na+:H+ antiporter subunit E n=1 Tax=Halomicrobium zhouii TaxID=767519 RepID=A0A1I6LXT5_9EURY|nr:Na+/H+ antiporter subunit E [Halomicrobium zhouii]SFS08266.1 multicomponent Na+:H+ antiporter subunit E [Halomicrobium zhouii]